MLPRLLDPDNEYNYAWADSAYSGECFESLLSFRAFKSLIQAKGAHNHPLYDAAKELNRSRSAIRACVEHIFDSITISIKMKADKNDWTWQGQDLAGIRISYLSAFATSSTFLTLPSPHKIHGKAKLICHSRHN